MTQDVRWQQRFANFEKALLFLQAGMVQAFEFTFELAWKTLKDYLSTKGITSNFPRDVIKDAFQTEIIQDGISWLRMLDKRKELSHTYNETSAQKGLKLSKISIIPVLIISENFKNIHFSKT